MKKMKHQNIAKTKSRRDVENVKDESSIWLCDQMCIFLRYKYKSNVIFFNRSLMIYAKSIHPNASIVALLDAWPYLSSVVLCSMICLRFFRPLIDRLLCFVIVFIVIIHTAKSARKGWESTAVYSNGSYTIVC